MRFHDRRLLGETGIHRSVPRKGRAMDRLEAMSIVLAVAEAGSHPSIAALSLYVVTLGLLTVFL